MAAHGIKVALSSALCPTPVVSYSIIDRKAGGGIVITASHNPWQWNGFKYKPEYGGSASPEVVAELEAPLPSTRRPRDPDAWRSARRRRRAWSRCSTRGRRTSRSSARLVDLDRLKAAGLQRVRRRDVRHRRRLLRRAARRREDDGHGAARLPQPDLPGHARAGADRAQPRRSMEATMRSQARSTSASRTTATPTASASPTRTASSSTSCRCSGCCATTCWRRAASAARS